MIKPTVIKRLHCQPWEKRCRDIKMFGSGISYLTIDLIGIWKTSDEHDFAEKRDRYLSTEKPPDAFYYHQLDYGRMKKIIHSLTGIWKTGRVITKAISKMHRVIFFMVRAPFLIHVFLRISFI